MLVWEAQYLKFSKEFKKIPSCHWVSGATEFTGAIHVLKVWQALTYHAELGPCFRPSKGFGFL